MVSAEFRQGEAQRYLFDFVTVVNSTKKETHIIVYNYSLLIKGSV